MNIVHDPRAEEAQIIKRAYDSVEKQLAVVGRLLRVTTAGKYMWASDHKTIVSGFRTMIRKLRNDVPNYNIK